MRRRKRRRTMRTDPDPDSSPAQPAASPAQPAAVAPLCVRGVCAVRPAAARAPAPSVFSATDKGHYLNLSPDGLTVEWDGDDDSMKYACSVRADRPVPIAGIAVYYFEVTVIAEGERGNIGIGLCNGKVKLEKMPGWEPGSYGYHGDDGHIFRQSGQQGIKYGPKYGTGDVVGCCWDLIDGIVFFTKNGKFLGKAFEDLNGPLFPTIGMQTKKGRVQGNFGAKPFVYDIEAYAAQQRESLLSNIRTRSLPADYRLLSNSVLGYLIHTGYAETAAAFAKDAGREELMEKERGQMLERQAVCRKIVSGDIDAAFEELDAKFPAVLREQSNISFLLRTQKFIEMLVSGASLEDTVEYGRRELSTFRTPAVTEAAALGNSEGALVVDGKSCAEILSDVYSLLAYVNLADSPNGHLTHQSRRDMVASKLNAAILQSQGRSTRSVLERLVRHTDHVLQESMRTANGAFALLNVQDFL